MTALTTILGWSYYGERCWQFLVGHWTIKPYRVLWTIAVFFGAITHLDLAWTIADTLNALMAGEQTAVTLGLNARAVRLRVFVIASLMTGVLVSISGSIGFVGLMVPHIARRLVGAEHRRLLPACVLLGSLFLVWVDVAARTLIAPEDLPIGVATAAIGGLFFIGLMRRR